MAAGNGNGPDPTSDPSLCDSEEPLTDAQSLPERCDNEPASGRYTSPQPIHAEAMDALLPEVRRRCMAMDPDADIPPLGHLSRPCPGGSTLHVFFHPDRTGQMVWRWVVEAPAAAA